MHWKIETFEQIANYISLDLLIIELLWEHLRIVNYHHILSF